MAANQLLGNISRRDTIIYHRLKKAPLLFGIHVQSAQEVEFTRVVGLKPGLIFQLMGEDFCAAWGYVNRGIICGPRDTITIKLLRKWSRKKTDSIRGRVLVRFSYRGMTSSGNLYIPVNGPEDLAFTRAGIEQLISKQAGKKVRLHYLGLDFDEVQVKFAHKGWLSLQKVRLVPNLGLLKKDNTFG